MPYILTLLLLVNTIYAKDFSVIIDKPYNDELFDVTQDYDRQITAIGFSKNHKLLTNKSGIRYDNPFDYLASISDKHGSKINLIKIDNNALVIKNKIFNIPKFAKAVSIIKTPSNGYFIGGYTEDGLLVILKLNAFGDVIFNKTFGNKNQDKMNTLIHLRDGGILAVGSSVTSRFKNDNLFENGLGGNDIYLTRFTNDGELLWSKKYGTQDDDVGVDAVEADDGSIIVLSTTKSTKYKNINIMRISENGDKVWLKNYNLKTLSTPYKIIKLRDNNFLVSLSQQNSLYKNQIRFLKFDLHKNIIFDKEIPTAYASGLKDIKEYSNGDIIGVGYVRDNYNTNGLVMNLSSDLKLICQEHFGDANYDIFNGVSILHNSQSAVSGLSTSKDSQESNMWIAKLNKDCTLAQVPLKTVDVYKELTKLFKEDIDTNKIIIKKDLTIEFNDYNLYFKVSKYELTKIQKSFLIKFSKKLIPFLHSIKNQIETLEVNGHTSSEWGDSNFSETYLNNAKLSLNRSYSALSYIFNSQNLKTKHWLSKVLKGSGNSYSKRISFNKVENKEKSRRISFKIILTKNPH